MPDRLPAPTGGNHTRPLRPKLPGLLGLIERPCSRVVSWLKAPRKPRHSKHFNLTPIDSIPAEGAFRFRPKNHFPTLLT